MLLLIISLKAEAFPIVEHFKLKPLIDKKYSIYTSDDIALIISGVGKINASIATVYLAMLFQKDIKAFLNVGIAGHVDLKIGSAILAHKIIDEGSKKALFPSMLFDLNILTKDVVTMDKSQDNYINDFVYDMESFGFFKSASKFSYVDLIHSLKIISDNKFSKIENLTKDIVKDLIFQNIEIIKNVANKLIKLTKKIDEKIEYPSGVIFDSFHFTECEKHQVKELLWKLSSLKENFFIDKNNLENFKNKKDLFLYLENLYKNSKLIL